MAADGNRVQMSNPISPNALSGEAEASFIHAKQVELLYRNFLPAVVGIMLISMLFVAAMWEHAEPGLLLAWLMAVWCVAMMRALLVRNFNKCPPASSEMRLWENRFVVGATIAGALWGLTAMLFIPDGDEVALMLEVLFIAGVSATGSSILAPSRRAVTLFLLSLLIPLIVQLFWYGDLLHLYMGVTVMIYLVVMLKTSKHGQMVIWKAMLTDMENERLKGALEAEKILVEAREHLRLLDNSPDIIARYDTTCRRIYSNAAHAKVVGRETFLGKTPVEDWALPTKPETAAVYQSHIRQVLDSGEQYEWELGWEQGDGSSICFLVRGVPEFGSDGKVTSVLVFSRDITERKRMEALLYEREQTFRNLVENAPDIIVRYDTQCRRTYINAAYTQASYRPTLLGKTPMEDWAIPTGPGEAAAFQANLQKVLDSGEPGEWEVRWKNTDGRSACFLLRGVPEFDLKGNVTSVLTFARDISDRLHLEEEMRRQASYDALTGLPNRRMFGDRLHEEIARADRTGKIVALLFIDLDRFKEVNDSLGHEVGDRLLIDAAQRIQHCVRESDAVARLGGDEFVVIVPEVEEAVHLGRIAQAIVDSMVQPFNLDGYMAYISASIGIACYPDDASNEGILVGCADQAMYAAKAQGRNGFSFFTRDMQEQVQHRLLLAHDMYDALQKGQLQVWMQPIVEVATGQVVKAEALLRWLHPQRGMVAPDIFIPVAEETGAIHEIGDWVFREAALTAKRWLEMRAANGLAMVPCQISVNMSPRQFVRANVGESWIEYLREIDLPAERMAIEITEGILLGDQADILGKLSKFREAGIQVALDDFGTGYSAMAYLKRFNIDYLKIDRSFVRDLETDPNDRAIAEAIVVMAHKLGLKVIAEGVETAGQRDMLAAVGCEFIQGFFYARPMPLNEFMEFVRISDTKSMRHSIYG